MCPTVENMCQTTLAMLEAVCYVGPAEDLLDPIGMQSTVCHTWHSRKLA